MNKILVSVDEGAFVNAMNRIEKTIESGHQLNQIMKEYTEHEFRSYVYFTYEFLFYLF